jgi:putative transposase
MVNNIYRHNNHSVTKPTAHIVWITKYRYKVLKGEIQKRARELIVQVCEAEAVSISNLVK